MVELRNVFASVYYDCVVCLMCSVRTRKELIASREEEGVVGIEDEEEEVEEEEQEEQEL